MLEAKGNLWGFPNTVVCITTNGFVKSNGRAVMGRGCAKEARDRYPGIDLALGSLIRKYGNAINLLNWEMHDMGFDLDRIIFSFPVKHNWWEKADIDLIKRSAVELNNLKYNNKEWLDANFVLPRPGCGNGQLDWADVKPVIAPILDDRITVVTF